MRADLCCSCDIFLLSRHRFSISFALPGLVYYLLGNKWKGLVKLSDPYQSSLRPPALAREAVHQAMQQVWPLITGMVIKAQDPAVHMSEELWLRLKLKLLSMCGCRKQDTPEGTHTLFFTLKAVSTRFVVFSSLPIGAGADKYLRLLDKNPLTPADICFLSSVKEVWHSLPGQMTRKIQDSKTLCSSRGCFIVSSTKRQWWKPKSRTARTSFLYFMMLPSMYLKRTGLHW